MLIGVISNVCGYSAAKFAIKGVVKASGVAAIDKFLVPVGIEIFSFMAADEAQKYVESKAKEFNEIREELKKAKEEAKEAVKKAREEKHNVFEDEVCENEDEEDFKEDNE